MIVRNAAVPHVDYLIDRGRGWGKLVMQQVNWPNCIVRNKGCANGKLFLKANRRRFFEAVKT